MSRASKWIVAVLVLAFGTSQSRAQDERIEPPKNAAEFWRAVQFDLNTGKYDAAAYYLKGFLASNPSDQDLLDLEAKDGLASFLRLRNVPVWSSEAAVQTEAKKNTEEVIKRVTGALEKKLGDVGRITRFIGNLRGTPEERAFAIRELQRSGARAVPQLVAALRAETDPSDRVNLLTVFPLLPEASVAPVLAAMDMNDAVLKTQLLAALGERADVATLPARTELNPLPTLDYLAASSKESPEVRLMARTLLARLRAVSPSALRPAKTELTEAALRFYKHQAQFVSPDTVPLWRYDRDQIVLATVTATQAEEYFGLRYARWALELDPNDQAAQVAFLSIATEKAFERGGLDNSLAISQPAAHDILATADVSALIATLDQALLENKTAVALGVTQVLGERAEVSAALSSRGRPGVLQRALDYPDRRVQFAAAVAIARLPNPGASGVTAKVVETLRQALAVESESGQSAKPRVLLVWLDRVESANLAKLFQTAGYDVVAVRTGQEAIRRIQRAADIDVIAMDSAVADLMLPDMLAVLRGDTSAAALRLRVIFTPTPRDAFASTAMEARLKRSTYQTTTLREDEIKQAIAIETRVHRLAEGWRNVAVVRGPLTEAIVKTAFAQEPAGKSETLSSAEKHRYAATAIELYRQMAFNAAAGFDLAPAGATIRQTLRVEPLARPAIDVVGRLPGREAQIDLAALVLDNKRSPELRIAAAENLVNHIQRFGMVLSADEIASLESLAAETKEPVLRGKVAAVVGAAGRVKTGDRLQRYQAPIAEATPAKPAEPAAPPAKKEAPKKEEED
ncbi:MAG: hypothetical protein ACJ8C4_02295 [Gemmataceae bacterium]